MKEIRNKVEYKKLEDLYHLDHNPRIISKENMDKLVKSIKNNPDYFEARPIICSDRTGKNIIIAGNQRLRAAGIAGLSEVPVVVLHGLDEEKEREITIRDNVELGEWDMDLLANEWNEQDLLDWGVDINWDAGIDEVIDKASEGSINEYSDDVDYDFKKLYRKRINPEISKKIDDGINKGKIRKEIGEILETRALQCSIFNFDEIIKFYRSGDASEEEKELLERLYLVFLTPKEAVEKAILKIEKTTGEIYDETLMEKENEAN